MSRYCFYIITALLCLSASSLAAQARSELERKMEGVEITRKPGEQIDLKARFVDETGKDGGLGRFFQAGRPVLLTLNYSDCPMLCNLQLEHLAGVLKEMDWAEEGGFTVLTVSIDPDESTERAAGSHERYTQSTEKPEAADNWHFLTGSQESINGLAESVGFGYRFDAESEEFLHKAAVIVLTPTGRVSGYLHGLSHDPAETRLAIREARNEEVSEKRGLFESLSCFLYDPTDNNPVVMSIMRIGGVVGVMLILGFVGLMWRRGRQARVAGA